MIRLLLTLLMFVYVGSAHAEAQDLYQFKDPGQETRYQELISELRCPKCQNQNIADSDAPIAADMRDEVYRMMKDGAGNEEIVDSLVARFGEFVRFKPAFNARTFLLWATPAIAVLIGLLAVAVVIVRARRRDREGAPLSDEERARAARILSGQDDRDRGTDS
ncbi:cytochrome c-type biogenesis protein [Marinobacter koreensis]|jgi:cytochrome c-type biogenesis protein CcmH|uniref:Cytochrome c-type biogenesis protein n=1 Tax=Marinobacter koreensis TaxID=335974 RepID=A0ABW0RJ79_9GAMM|nr:cytochrome c-type biogenesis protein [Marinobacter koreensis]MCK7547115.1 cytochrome c-type biogenesis protein CcmH [Marinobacter koreensis]MDX1818394.1 cytochrome c-type biogenesis protein [Marinobacter sp.]